MSDLVTAITPAHLREWDACYSDEEITAIYAGRESLTPLDILALDIPAADRLWVVLRPEVMGERALRLAACDIVERVLPFYEAQHPGDDRPRRAIETARRYARGEATRAEMGDARAAAWDAWAAAEAAAEAAALAASEDAAWDAALAAADAAAWDAALAYRSAAAWAAEREAQVAIVRGYLERAEPEVRRGDNPGTNRRVGVKKTKQRGVTVIDIEVGEGQTWRHTPDGSLIVILSTEGDGVTWQSLDDMSTATTPDWAFAHAVSVGTFVLVPETKH